MRTAAGRRGGRARLARRADRRRAGGSRTWTDRSRRYDILGMKVDQPSPSLSLPFPLFSDGGPKPRPPPVLCYFLCFVKAWEIIENRLSNHWEEFEFTQQSLNDRHFPNE